MAMNSRVREIGADEALHQDIRSLLSQCEGRGTTPMVAVIVRESQIEAQGEAREKRKHTSQAQDRGIHQGHNEDGTGHAKRKTSELKLA